LGLSHAFPRFLLDAILFRGSLPVDTIVFQIICFLPTSLPVSNASAALRPRRDA
jgi:hypothetical protein